MRVRSDGRRCRSGGLVRTSWNGPAGYDDPAFDGRSRVAHERWLAGLDRPVLRLDSASPPEVLRDQVLPWEPVVT